MANVTINDLTSLTGEMLTTDLFEIQRATSSLKVTLDDILNGTLIKTAYEAEADTNAFTDADKTKLDSLSTEASTVATISGKISQGTNITISGSGTEASPYVINSTASGGGGSSSWGSISGTIGDQADLQAALGSKQDTITNSDSITEGSTNLFLTSSERTKVSQSVVSDVSEASGATTIDNIIALTQAQYDAIGTPSTTTLYVIKDA